MFASYEPGREGFITLIANYLPLQDAYGGPNYFQLDPNALYEIHVDNNGDAREDITFQFRFKNKLAGTTLPIGGKNIAIPLIQSGPVTDINSPALNVAESYTVDIVRGDRRGRRTPVTNAVDGSDVFEKPVDNIGTKTLPDYAGYAAKHIYNINIPGCSTPGKLFVGQRQDPFAVNLGVIFDLVHAPLSVITDPTLINAAPNTIGDKNVTTLALEVHKSCLVAPGSTDPVIGACVGDANDLDMNSCSRWRDVRATLRAPARVDAGILGRRELPRRRPDLPAGQPAPARAAPARAHQAAAPRPLGNVARPELHLRAPEPADHGA